MLCFWFFKTASKVLFSVVHLEKKCLNLICTRNNLCHQRENKPGQCPKIHNKILLKASSLQTKMREAYFSCCCFYFQDASLIHITPLYLKHDVHIITVVKQIVGGIFKFQLNVLQFASKVCIFPNLYPVSKIGLKLLFIPLVFGFIFSLFVLAAVFQKYKIPPTKLWKTIQMQTPVALMLAILFSFQKLAVSLFSLINCVSFEDKLVLFLDGNVECYSLWQCFVILVLVFSLLPLTLFICFLSVYMKSQQISGNIFLLGCLFPIPVGIYIVFKARKVSASVSPITDTESKIFSLLQGPYKEMVLSFTYGKISVCYSGVLLLRRLILIVIYCFSPNIVVKMLLFLLLSMVSLISDLIVKPCKEKRANVSVVVSDSAMVVVVIINLMKANNIAAEYSPVGPILRISETLQFIENCLLLWIPVVGLGFILLVAVLRLVLKIVGEKHKSS